MTETIEAAEPAAPEAVEPAPGTGLAVAPAAALDITSSPGALEWAALRSQAQVIARSGIVPAALRGKPDDVLVIALTARELGIGLMTACQKLHVIDGKPGMAAELCLALILRAGHSYRVVENGEQRAAVKVHRSDWPAGEWDVIDFTEAEAKQAGLTDKAMWKKYRRAMLWARCVSKAGRMVFPDVLSGVSYNPEELGAVDIDPVTGEIIDVDDLDEPPAWPEGVPGRRGDPPPDALMTRKGAVALLVRLVMSTKITMGRDSDQYPSQTEAEATAGSMWQRAGLTMDKAADVRAGDVYQAYLLGPFGDPEPSDGGEATLGSSPQADAPAGAVSAAADGPVSSPPSDTPDVEDAEVIEDVPADRATREATLPACPDCGADWKDCECPF